MNVLADKRPDSAGSEESQLARFPFDHINFLNSHPHLGEPLEGGLPVIRRGGLPVPHSDAIGIIPYSLQIAETAPPALLSVLQRQGLVSFLATLKPGFAIEENVWRAHGFHVQLANPHFVWKPCNYSLQQSTKTRRNVRIGRKHWSVISCDPTQHVAEMATVYANLFTGKVMSAVLNYPPAHFALLGAVPGIEMLGAFDHEGMGAYLIYARWKQEIHTLHLAGAEGSHRTCAAYALFQELWEREHAEQTIYLGGTPRSTNGPGIARFKQRFANTTLTPLQVRTILDPARCEALLELRGRHDWFPPYRSQYGD